MEVVKEMDSSREERLTRMVEQYQSSLLTMCYAYRNPPKFHFQP